MTNPRCQLMALYLAVIVCGLCGCKRGKPHGRPHMTPPRKTVSPAMSDIPVYNRYYAMWRIAHANLETIVRGNRDRSDIDHSFDQTVRNLRLMKKLLDDKKKARIEKLISGYEDLKGSVIAGQPSRRTTARLDRLKAGVKISLSPERVNVLNTKDVPE